ncbi:MAG: acyl-CoA thioesterase [Bacteroidia bacterium]
MNYKDYKHSTKIQVRYKDIDMQGHLNNANHLTYFEIARVDYFKEVISTKIDWTKNGLILARIEIDYKTPVFLEDDVYCFTKLARLGTKSFTLDSALVKQTNTGTQLCAEGRSVIVCYNYELNTTIEIPKEWREAVETYERHGN